MAGRFTGAKRSAGLQCGGLALAIALAGCAAPKPPSAFEQDFDDETKPWVEVATQLPPAPRDTDLAIFGVSGATQFQFGIDRTTLDIGTDGVIRYVLVATSPQGARNVSYEGIRCESQEKKIYATGRSDGTWVRARNSAWTPIEEIALNRQHAALMKEYFCPNGIPTGGVPEILGRLRITQSHTIL